MPYSIRKKSNKFELRLARNNQLLGTHSTKEKAQRQIRAIEAHKHGASKMIGKQRFFLSENKHKKLKVLVGDKWVHFGDSRYQHYYDRTGLLPKSQNHLDKERRDRYLKRASNIYDKNGKLTKNNIYSPNYYAMRILW